MKESRLDELSQPLGPDGELSEEQGKFILNECGRGEVYRGLVAQYGREAVAEALSVFISPQVVRIQLAMLCPEPSEMRYNGDNDE